jgi:REP element-mobilizing transposase RayT
MESVQTCLQKGMQIRGIKEPAAIRMAVETFNKQSPPRFRGLHPDLPIRMYQRHLPHWRQEGATYAVTFRQADSIPQEQLQSLKRWRAIWEKQHPEPRSEITWMQLAQEITKRTDRWMDEGYGSCVFREARFAKMMSNSLLHFQDQRHFTSCFVVMPNHVHVVIRPMTGFELEDCLQRIKQYVATHVNKDLHRHGPLWEEESYDRIVRDEEHLWNVVQYIGRNPKKAGIPVAQWVRWIHPDWQAAGWDFVDE